MMKDELSIAGRSNLAEFVTDANEVVHFQLVRSEDDLEKAMAEAKPEAENGVTSKVKFNPEMTHQVFGEQEKIFGYLDLNINLFFTCGSLKSYLDVQFSQKISPIENDGIEADKVTEPIVELLAENQMAKNIEELREVMRKELDFKPPGEKIDEFKIITESDGERIYEAYHGTNDTSGIRDFHSRFQPFIMFFIDAASYIDIDDSNWNLYFLANVIGDHYIDDGIRPVFVRVHTQNKLITNSAAGPDGFERFTTADGKNRYASAGYLTVYHYYAYLSKIRPRISQMLILPPFQKQGLGAKLLETVQTQYYNRDDVVDITVEDPSDDFIRLRDFVDSRNCLTLESFKADKLKLGFCGEMLEESNEKFKMGKKQARKVYEILRLKNTNKSNQEEYKAYRIDVKQRLNKPYHKEEKQLEKLKKHLTPEEFSAATLNTTNKEQKFENLKNQFEELEEHYMQVIERIAKS